MLTLMDMLSEGANGKMIDQVARQFDLSRDQTIAAMEVLLPAFSQGLKRNASDPAGMMNFLNALSSGRHADYYSDPTKAFGMAGTEEGNAILGYLFGSKEVSRAVADQAAQFSGLSQSMLKSMLPTLAPIILGGLYKQMSGAAPAPDTARRSPADNPLGPLGEIFGQMTGGAANPWGKMFEEMMRGGQTKGRSSPSSSNPWGDILGQMMGGARSPGSNADPSADNPLGRMFEEMLRGGPTEARPEADEPEPERSSPRGYDELFGDMFETGRKVQNEYQKNMESIFDQYLSGMQKR
jgi:hypothetical protein